MKKTIFRRGRFTALALAGILTAGISMSFTNQPFSPLQQYDRVAELGDTIPEKDQHLTIRQYDELVKQFDREMKKAKAGIDNTDFKKVNEELNRVMNETNFDAIMNDVSKALSEIDIAAIEKETRDALKEITSHDFDLKIKESLEQARKALKEINTEQQKKQMKLAKENLQQAKQQLQKLDIESVLRKAEEGISRAGENLHKQKQFFDVLEKDGLINQQKGFSIDYKNGQLFINGKAQPEEVVSRYKQWLDNEDYHIIIDEEK